MLQQQHGPAVVLPNEHIAGVLVHRYHHIAVGGQVFPQVGVAQVGVCGNLMVAVGDEQHRARLAVRRVPDPPLHGHLAEVVVPVHVHEVPYQAAGVPAHVGAQVHRPGLHLLPRSVVHHRCRVGARPQGGLQRRQAGIPVLVQGQIPPDVLIRKAAGEEEHPQQGRRARREQGC